MKKVLYISYDGAEEPLTRSQVLPYIRGLSKKGCKFFLLTFDKKMQEKNTMTSKLKKDGIVWYSLRYHKNPSLLAKAYDIGYGFLFLQKIIEKEKIELIHARSYVAGMIAYLLKRFSGIPYLFDIRGFLADERLDSGDWKLSSIAYKTTKAAERLLFKNADYVVVLTENGKSIIIDKFAYRAEKIKVIPTCVDLEYFESVNKNYKNKAFKLVYIGSLGTWYMLDEMLDFYKTLKKIRQDAKFLFLNRNENEKIKEAVRKKHLDDKDIDIMKVSYEDVASALRECTASIFFIKDTFSKKASSPTKFAESLAAGLPVITNKGIGDLDEIIPGNDLGIAIENFTEEEYKKAISKLMHILKNKDAFFERKEKFLKKSFSLESGIERYIEVYDEILR